MADVSTATRKGSPLTPNDPRKKIPGSSAFKGGLGPFLQETWVEITRKTTWPTKPELVRSTSVVLATIIAVSLYLALCDVIMSQVSARLLGAR